MPSQIARSGVPTAWPTNAIGLPILRSLGNFALSPCNKTGYGLVSGSAPAWASPKSSDRVQILNRNSSDSEPDVAFPRLLGYADWVWNLQQITGNSGSGAYVQLVGLK